METVTSNLEQEERPLVRACSAAVQQCESVRAAINRSVITKMDNKVVEEIADRLASH